MRQIIFIFVSIFFSGIGFCQSDSISTNSNQVESKKKLTDSGAVKPAKTIISDSVNKNSLNNNQGLAYQNYLDSLKNDSISKTAVPIISQQQLDTLSYEKYYVSAWLPFQKVPIFEIVKERNQLGEDASFYLLVVLLGILAGMRLIFPKYFNNLFLLFFQTTIRQKQTREQLLQNNLASIFLNLLFFISAGLYGTLYIQYNHLLVMPFYNLLLYGMAVLAIVYLGKFIFLSFSGWVFNVSEATSAYTFIVFLVNKILGIILIPFIILISFSPLPIKQIAVTISAVLILLLFVYRYLISFVAIRSNLKVSALHFFLYLCAVEILPLVLIFKLLVNFVTGSI